MVISVYAGCSSQRGPSSAKETSEAEPSAPQSISDPTDGSVPPDTSVPTGISVPQSLVVALGQGGGVTGAWSGYTIHADGSVESWRGPVAQVSPKPTGKLADSDVLALWQSIEEIGFFSQTMDESGEMTAFIRVSTDSLDHRVAWVPNPEVVEPPKHSVEALYRQIKILAASSEPVTDEANN